jgi:hypothetical protein
MTGGVELVVVGLMYSSYLLPSFCRYSLSLTFCVSVFSVHSAKSKAFDAL